jgi:hypothetical protein
VKVLAKSYKTQNDIYSAIMSGANTINRIAIVTGFSRGCIGPHVRAMRADGCIKCLNGQYGEKLYSVTDKNYQYVDINRKEKKKHEAEKIGRIINPMENLPVKLRLMMGYA